MSEFCKICSAETTFIFNGKILNKYNINYFRCPNCDFIQTENPYWLEEAYGSAISSLDIGLVGRNIKTQSLLRIYSIFTLLSLSQIFKY